ncbi:uncharacterized protein FTOL_07550 [Fusarium torulosum]|uniref:Uncharacterized protein n=1 Tax=Fusarium torulosum TaxID=33205 RepID=A0AAE8MB05_9HYPO|nr:uncharacterized protein FTOL_07550 [Fusarium torulosum]
MADINLSVFYCIMFPTGLSLSVSIILLLISFYELRRLPRCPMGVINSLSWILCA